MENPLKVLFVSESFEGYSSLIGYVLQKKPVDLIITYGTKTALPSESSVTLNQWLLKKGYPIAIPRCNVIALLNNTSTVSSQRIGQALRFIESAGAARVVCGKEAVELQDFPADWGWNQAVLETILNLSDLPVELKRAIFGLNKRSRSRLTLVEPRLV